MADPGEVSAATMSSDDEAFRKAFGARLTAARKAQSLTQVELARRLGVAQQTLAHYETGRIRMPLSMLPVVATELRLTFDELLVGREPGRSKRGPVSRLERQIDAVRKLPPSKQRFVADMLDAVLAQQTAS
jgi:transcriptional regulator with XRE-family HTH domain